MTNPEAIERLQQRGTYLSDKLVTLQADGRNAFWTERDIEANDLAIAALQYTEQMRLYEESAL